MTDEQILIDRMEPKQLAKYIERRGESTWTTTEKSYLDSPIESQEPLKREWDFWRERLEGIPPGMRYYRPRWEQLRRVIHKLVRLERARVKRPIVGKNGKVYRRNKERDWRAASDYRKNLSGLPRPTRPREAQPNSTPLVLARLASGPATSAELYSLLPVGYPISLLSRMVRQGRIVSVGRGVFALPGEANGYASLWERMRVVLEDGAEVALRRLCEATGKQPNELSPILTYRIKVGDVVRVLKGVYRLAP